MKSVPLSDLLTKFYEEFSRYEVGAPMKMMKELDFNSLVISDMEISDEDIHVLIKFLSHKQVIGQIEKIEINKSSGGKSTTKRQSSSIFGNSHRFFKELTTFIENCTKLKSVTFEQMDIPSECLTRLGRALSHSKSTIRWVGFHVCKFGGDDGLHELTPYLARMHLQVLGLEYCGLTDKSVPYIVSILKAQENRLDSLYWNSTLRVDAFYDQDGTRLEQETSQVYGQGLVALSLNGNNLTGKGILPLARVLRLNYWLLGLNLANNKLDQTSVTQLITALETNTIIQGVLLKNNPGFDQSKVLQSLYHIITRNTQDEGGRDDDDDDAVQRVNDLATRLNNSITGGIVKASNGNSRIAYLPVRVAQLLKCWTMLHLIEANTVITTSESTSQRNGGGGGAHGHSGTTNSTRKHPDESLLTNSSTLSNKKRYQEGINEDVKTIRSKEKGMGAAYSVFHFLDRDPSALQGLLKPSNNNNSNSNKQVTIPSPFADLDLSTDEISQAGPTSDAVNTSTASANGGGVNVNGVSSVSLSKFSVGAGSRRYLTINGEIYQSFTVPKEDDSTNIDSHNGHTAATTPKKEEPPRNYPVSPLERRSYVDLNQAKIMESIENRIRGPEDTDELFMTAIPPGSPHRYTDPLENAIAPVSPMHDMTSAHFLSTAGSAGAHRSPHTPSHRYSLEEIVDEQQRQSDYWPSNNNNNNNNNGKNNNFIKTHSRSHSEERPPSRMSIRPINDILLHGDHHQNRYLPMLQRYLIDDTAAPAAFTTRPQTAPTAARERPQSTKRKLTKRRESTKPPLPNYLKPQTRHQEVRQSTQKQRSASADRGRKPSTQAPTEHHHQAVSRSAVFGKSERDTRVRSRSQEHKRQAADHYYLNHQQHHAANGSAVKVVKPSPSRRVATTPTGSTPIDTASVGYLMSLDQHVKDLTHTMLHATRNLEEASEKFQRVSQSFNESMQMNTSRLDLSNIHTEALSYMMDNSMHMSRPDTAPNGNIPRSRPSPDHNKPRNKASHSQSQTLTQSSQSSLNDSIQLEEMKSMIKEKLHEYLSSWVPVEQRENE